MIGVFDSGIGGFEVLSKLHDKQLDVFYYSDSQNFPYGNKTDEQIIQYLKEALCFFEQSNISDVILACNTASLIFAKYLKNEFPNLKVFHTLNALKKFNNEKDLLILATTLGAKMLKEIKLFEAEKIIGMNGLAVLIEEEKFEDAEKYIRKYKLNGKKILYACTHFPLIHTIFCKILQEKCYFNPVNEIVRQVVKQKKYTKNNEVTFKEIKIEKKYNKWKINQDVNMC